MEGKVYLEVLIAPLVTVRRIQREPDKTKRQKDLLNLPYKSYKTIQEMIADGWQV